MSQAPWETWELPTRTAYVRVRPPTLAMDGITHHSLSAHIVDRTARRDGYYTHVPAKLSIFQTR